MGSLLLLLFALALLSGSWAVSISKEVPSPADPKPFYVGPLEISSELATNGQSVLVTVSLNTVMVAATVFSSAKTEFPFDVMVGTSAARGVLVANMDQAMAINSSLTLQLAGQDPVSYTGAVFEWKRPAKPIPSVPFSAPTLKPFIMGTLAAKPYLMEKGKVHVIIYAGTLPAAAVTLMPTNPVYRFSTVVGSLTASGTVKLVEDSDGFNSIQLEVVTVDWQSPAEGFRGAILFWNARSELADDFVLPSGQPFYFGPTTMINCGLRSVNGVNVVDAAIKFGDLTGTSTTLSATHPLWYFDSLIGLTATNGSLVAMFAPKGEISSVVATATLYESGQNPVPYMGGVFYWMEV